MDVSLLTIQCTMQVKQKSCYAAQMLAIPPPSKCHSFWPFWCYNFWSEFYLIRWKWTLDCAIDNNFPYQTNTKFVHIKKFKLFIVLFCNFYNEITISLLNDVYILEVFCFRNWFYQRIQRKIKTSRNDLKSCVFSYSRHNSVKSNKLA